jgi:di/tricarboxylate transporter
VIGAAFGIAQAMDNSGLAHATAHVVFGWLDGAGPRGLLAGVFILTVAMTALMSNNAAAALVLPIALQAAAAQQAPLLPVAVTVAIAASSDFITPIGYQTNLMVMGPGGYSWWDFSRFGTPLTILVGLVCVLLVPIAYP